jgi:hypothetical protein
MVGHENEFMKLKAPLIAIASEGVEKQASQRVCLEEGPSLPCNRSYEKRPDFLRSMSHLNSPGLKP